MANRTLSVVEEPNAFLEKEVSLRGVNYKFRELSSEDYDKLYKTAEKQDGEVDTIVLLRLMVTKSIVEPPLTPDQLGKLPLRVSRELTRVVSDLHFEEEEEDPKTA